MFNKDDLVINKKGQVCKIIDILFDYNVGMGKNDYYVLVPYSSLDNQVTKYFIPADRVGIIRAILTKKEILKLIDSIPTIEEIWITNPKIRKAKFRELYDKGGPTDTFRLIKSIESKKVELEKNNKVLSFTDENFLREIKNNIFQEMAIALKMDVSEIENFIKKRLKS